MYDLLRALLSDKTGGEIFVLFGAWHFFYVALVAVTITAMVLYCKNKCKHTRKRVARTFIDIAFTLYMADFFLMPFSYGYIDIDKLPFHLCTSMSILCVLARRTNFLSKFKTSFTIMGFIGALMYLSYPAGVAEADGYSYRIIQTVLYHGLMLAQGVFAIAFDDLDLDVKNFKFDLIAVFCLTVWAFLGNTLYSGTLTETCTCVEGCTNVINVYNHDFNWFFVKHDALYIISDEIDVYFAPFMMIIIVFGLSFVIRFLSL